MILTFMYPLQIGKWTNLPILRPGFWWFLGEIDGETVTSPVIIEMYQFDNGPLFMSYDGDLVKLEQFKGLWTPVIRPSLPTKE